MKYCEPVIMNFRQWLDTQTLRDDAVGDLAKDAHPDETFPQDPLGDVLVAEVHDDWKTKLNDYLVYRGACPEAHSALDQAFEEYQAYILISLKYNRVGGEHCHVFLNFQDTVH